MEGENLYKILYICKIRDEQYNHLWRYKISLHSRSSNTVISRWYSERRRWNKCLGIASEQFKAA